LEDIKLPNNITGNILENKEYIINLENSTEIIEKTNETISQVYTKQYEIVLIILVIFQFTFILLCSLLR